MTTGTAGADWSVWPGRKLCPSRFISETTDGCETSPFPNPKTPLTRAPPSGWTVAAAESLPVLASTLLNSWPHSEQRTARGCCQPCSQLGAARPKSQSDISAMVTLKTVPEMQMTSDWTADRCPGFGSVYRAKLGQRRDAPTAIETTTSGMQRSKVHMQGAHLKMQLSAADF